MPHRFLGLFIVGFWLLTTSWLFVREIRPRLWPGTPPPYTIDLTDEAQSNISSQWTIFKDGEQKGYCKTSVKYAEADDTFLLSGEFKLWKDDRTRPPDTLLKSSYRITREGELRGLEATLVTDLTAFVSFLPLGNWQVNGTIEGKVDKGLFSPIATLREPFAYSQALKPVKVSSGVSVLNPLQPIHRLAGLRRGQRWEVRLVHPLSDLAHQYIQELTGTSPVTQLDVLQARVLPNTQTLDWGGRREETTCLVIEYEGEDTTARTWVRESDGLVLKQELSQGKTYYVLVRDS